MNMIQNDIVNRLREQIHHINNTYPDINYGGCGTFSYHLYCVLNEKYNLNPEIVYLTSPYPPGGKPDYDIKFRHIMIKLGDYYIDNNGLCSLDFDHLNKWDTQVNPLTMDKLHEMINIPELWNDKFNHGMASNMVKDIYNI